MSGLIGKIPSRSKVVLPYATVDQGGTGASTFTDGGILLGSGSGAVTATAALADSEMLVGDGTTDPAIESGATLRTSIGLGNVNNVADASQTSVGTISTGTWEATDVAVAHGGTGASTLTANYALLGNGTSALQMIAPSTSGNVLTSNGSTWASTAVAASVNTKSVAKAWVNFDGSTGSGTGSADVTMRDSFNVSSVTDRGTGQYQVTFTQLDDADYSVLCSAGASVTTAALDVAINSTIGGSRYLPTTTATRMVLTRRDTGALDDAYDVCVAIFGDAYA